LKGFEQVIETLPECVKERITQDIIKGSSGRRSEEDTVPYQRGGENGQSRAAKKSRGRVRIHKAKLPRKEKREKGEATLNAAYGKKGKDENENKNSELG